ncbi:MAG: DUF1080 domain-containing protein [Acidobacteria bacterium]|nr:MAG: DUF1080 domain-containing protein [Acidobacteriota bacterium]
MHKTILTCVSAAVAATVLLAILGARTSPSAASAAEQQWKIHDRSRPQSPVITPGESSTQDRPGRPPSDATVLFGGADLSQWQAADGGPAKWKVGDGYFEVAPGTGDMQTRGAFGDCQLHVEWAAPSPPHGEDQDRGNSGVFLHGLYEVQVLDSYQSKTYADGQAAAIYGQYPPLVNACRRPGEWQTYDIVFHGARFDPAGKLTRPAYITVLHNGVLVQDRVRIMGPTAHMKRPPYQPTTEKLPLRLQDHNHPVRYRNIWIRELGTEGEPSVQR